MLIFARRGRANRHPVASALSLVVSFLCLAALFVGLDAFLIAVLQVLVYAGAVMVLFLFIIMLLDLKAEERRKLNLLSLPAAALVALAFVVAALAVLRRFPAGAQPFPRARATRSMTCARSATTIFTTYNLPLQVVGVLILVATIGVVILSRRELK